MIEEDIMQTLTGLCKTISRKSEIQGGCIYGSRAGGYAKEESEYDILLILKEFKKGIQSVHTRSGTIQVAILVVDRALFESDIRSGALGEFLSTRLLSPHFFMFNDIYMTRQELRVKKRFVEEEIENIVIRYGSMATGLLIAPEYFALARLRKMAAFYPALMYGYVQMLHGELKQTNLPRISAGYTTILNELQQKGTISFQDGLARVQDDAVAHILSRRSVERIANAIHITKKLFYSYMSRGRGSGTRLELLIRELGSVIGTDLGPMNAEYNPQDPRSFLFLRTSTGKVGLDESKSILEVVHKIRPGTPVTISPLAGVLNEVTLVTSGDERFVAKRFTDWLTLKWFTLNLVTFGTKRFSVLGRTRLSNEYGMNRLLSDKGILVPEIVHISIPDRLLIERFVDGLNIGELVKRAAQSEQITASEYETAVGLGRALANIHSIDVVIGDSKPENLVASSEKNIYVLDLEQAERRGDPSWDVAVLLFYSGHYSPLMTQGLDQFIDGFACGYLDRGKSDVLEKAASFPYLRVFSIWTSPQVLYKIAQSLRKTRG